jgi:hypothetical protein
LVEKVPAYKTEPFSLHSSTRHHPMWAATRVQPGEYPGEGDSGGGGGGGGFGGVLHPAVNGMNGDVEGAPNANEKTTTSKVGAALAGRNKRVNSLRAIASLVQLGRSSSSSRPRLTTSSSQKHLRESSAQAVKDARGGASVKSRASLGFGITTLYFYVLERSWAFCACVFGVALVCSLALSTAACYVVGGYDDPNESPTAPLRYAASHVMTMGFGTVSPVVGLPAKIETSVLCSSKAPAGWFQPLNLAM